jgi:DNA polymerase (family X)
MTNKELADIFSLIADLMQIKGEVVYKYLAYRKAAENILMLPRYAKDILEEGGLEDIPGVGKAISAKMEELLTTGELQFLNKLVEEVPASLATLLAVPDLGPKKIKMFWETFDITTIEQLKEAAESGQLSTLPGMGKKSEDKILAGIEALSRRSGRQPIGDVWDFVHQQVAVLQQIEGVEKVEVAGSFRRRRETVGDVDLLVAAQSSELIMDTFTSQVLVARVLGKGKIKSSVEFNNGLQAQVWVLPPEEFGTGLQYATGSKNHNVKVREHALSQGYSLSEHFLKKEDGTKVYCATEEEVYKIIGFPWIPPELREDRGEIQFAKDGKIPDLVEISDIGAEMHCHTVWSDGKMTILEMAEAAIEKGFHTLNITDHSGGLAIANGLSEERLYLQMEEIKSARVTLGDRIQLLHGTEMEIKASGELDYSDDVLSQLDFVIASLHVSTRQPREKVTKRMLNAINNPHVDCIAHPTNRLLGSRDGADLDMDKIFEAALATDTILEINANPMRLDLSDMYARRAAEMGIKIAINTDAHHKNHLRFLHFGVANARRAWISKKQIYNTWSAEAIKDWINSRPN